MSGRPGEPRRTARRRTAARAEEHLALWARRSVRAQRRRPRDAEGRAFDYRTEFQRDRDRIVHARAFRRLGDKRRARPDGDAHRTRQTHALEVSQLGRTVGRALGLNEDLIEAIALGHDLGYPPLGEEGGDELGRWLRGDVPVDGLPASTARDLGGFEVSAQSLRVVDTLEKRYDHPGINLTDDVRAGIWKQADPARTAGYPDELRDGLEPGAPASAEAQAVRLACRIASIGEALDDLLRASPNLLERVERLGLVGRLLGKLGERYRRGGGRFLRLSQIHRGLTHLLVTGGIRSSRANLERWAARERVDDERRFHDRRGALPRDVVGLSGRVEAMLGELAAFVGREQDRTRDAARRRRRARIVIDGLFRSFLAEPATLEDYVLLRFRETEGGRYLRDVPVDRLDEEVARRYRGSATLVRLIGDHVAGMTDTYAIEEYGRLCGGGVP